MLKFTANCFIPNNRTIRYEVVAARQLSGAMVVLIGLA
jgi:hypothetical protein